MLYPVYDENETIAPAEPSPPVKTPREAPGLVDVLVLYALALLYTNVMGTPFAALPPFWGMSLFTLGIGLMPVLYAAVRGFPLSSSFPLGKIAPGQRTGALLMTLGLVSLALAATGLLILLMPSGMSGFEDTAIALTGLNDWAAVIAVGVLPALCEEILFRGFILSGLARITGKWRAIAVSAALFGILHQDPARIPITAGVGLALGYVAWETRSIELSAAMHCLYNLSLFFMSRLAGAAQGLSETQGLALDAAGSVSAPWGLGILSALMPLAPFVAFGVLLVRAGAKRVRARRDTESIPRL